MIIINKPINRYYHSMFIINKNKLLIHSGWDNEYNILNDLYYVNLNDLKNDDNQFKWYKILEYSVSYSLNGIVISNGNNINNNELISLNMNTENNDNGKDVIGIHVIKNKYDFIQWFITYDTRIIPIDILDMIGKYCNIKNIVYYNKKKYYINITKNRIQRHKHQICIVNIKNKGKFVVVYDGGKECKLFKII